ELVRKVVPQDVEAQHKAKDLAASATIARGRYEDALQRTPSGESDDEDEDDEDTATEGKKPAASPYLHAGRAAEPAGDRHGREVATLRARIEPDPTHAGTYLHLAGILRRAGQLDQARDVLRRGLGPAGNSFEMSIELADLDIEPFRQNLAITEAKLEANPDD